MRPKFSFSLFGSSLTIAVILLLSYNWYWSEIEGWKAGYDDNAEMWSYWRGQIEYLSSDDIVIIGSSRSHFNNNLDIWDSVTGKRPVMLSTAGGSPLPVIEDIVNNSKFRGTLIVGIAPGLFFTRPESPGATFIKKDRVDYYHKQTYAQKFNHWVYGFIDPHFSHLDPDLSLQSLINRIPLNVRDSIPPPLIWPQMVTMDKYRSVRMTIRMENDTAYQRRQTNIWDFFGYKNHYRDSIDVIYNQYLPMFDKFKKEGGRFVFISGPESGNYKLHAPTNWPRDQYWDRLINESGGIGFHYEDFPETKNMDPPEWSHLNRKQADIYTLRLLRFLSEHQILN